MKILESYILKENLRPFFVSAAIVTFVMLLDKLIDLLNLIIEKRLDILAIYSLFSLSLPFIIALSIPMSVLVATILSFGRMSVDNELVAFKASGINIFKLMKPVIISAFLLSLFMLYFNNNILPETNHSLKKLMIRISYQRPVTMIKQGQFTQIKNYSIYVSELVGDIMHGVVIYTRQANMFPHTIVSRKGTIEVSADGNSLKAVLYEGEYHERDEKEPGKYSIRTFDELTINLPDLGYQAFAGEIDHRSDREIKTRDMVKINRNRYEDILQDKSEIPQIRERIEEIKELPGTAANRREIIRQENMLSMRLGRIAENERKIREFEVEIYKKYAIAFACLIFVFLGVPIGMMTRTSGVGMAFTVSTFIFIIYYIGLVTGEQLGDNGTIPPLLAMWLPNMIFSVTGFYLVYTTMKYDRFIDLKSLKDKLLRAIKLG